MKNYIIPIAISIVSFVLFFFTMVPGIYYTDSGELAAAIIKLGIAHPTGYPLFTILGHFWSWLPLGASPIYQLNIFSAFLIAVSSGILYLTIEKLLNHIKIAHFSKIIIGIFSSLTFSTSLTIWQLSNSIEVYPLQVLIFNLVLYFAIQAKFEKNYNWLLVSLLVGLGFSNHLSIIFIIPGLLYLFFINSGTGFSINKIGLSELVFLLIPLIIGVSFYLYLPIRSASLPEVNWGWVHRGLDEFLYHVQGKQYQVWMFSGEKLGENAANYFVNLPYQLGIIGILTALIGIYRLSKINRDIVVFLIISALFNYLYAINYSIHDIDSYFSLSLIVLVLFSAFGFVYLVEKFNKNVVYLIIILPIINLSLNLKDTDKSMNYFVEDYTKAVSSTLDKNAIFITAQWDYYNSAMIYYQNVENFRKDITIVEKELMRRTWYPLQFKRSNPEIYKNSEIEFIKYQKDLDNFEKGNDPITYQSIQLNYIKLFRSIIDNNIDKRPVYIGLDIIESEPEIIKGYNIVPRGLSFQIVKNNENSEYNFDDKLLTRFINLSKNYRISYLDSGIVNVCAMNFLNTGRYYQVNGDINSALKAYNLSYAINQDSRVYNLINELKVVK